MAWMAPLLVGRIPVAALANPPALVELFAETITEELDFRLEAENMLDVARSLRRAGPAALRHPPPPPRAGDPPGAGDGAPRRASPSTTSTACRRAGVDTDGVVRTGMIGFMEGAMLHGIFHGDLHGGNLFVLPDGRTALLDFGITGRLDEPRRLAFLRLLVGGTHQRRPGPARGAARPRRPARRTPTSRRVIADLGLDRPPIDPTTLDADEMVGEIQRVVKALLGYGARMPKELMLFVKNMVFLDGAIATLAPDLDLFAE